MVNAHLKVLELSNTQASWVQMAFTRLFFCMALPAGFICALNIRISWCIGLGFHAIGALLTSAAITEQFWISFTTGLYVLTLDWHF
jgi:FHS family L-fucose permease-like MFS transporter